MAGVSWIDGRLCAIAFEQGAFEKTEVALVFVGDQQPAERVAVRLDDRAVQRVAERIADHWVTGRPLIGFAVTDGLTMLDRATRRHLGRGFAVTGPIVDPFVIDRALDKRPGQRTLAETCRLYQVRHDGPGDPIEDALAVARLAWRVARRYPRQVGRASLKDLHEQQIDWSEPHGLWPLRPYTVNDHLDRAVLDAIRRKLLTDWEHKLRTDGPEPFRPELHIVNDSRSAQPSFTSVRAVRSADAAPIALMGALANALAADRIVVAWEPVALTLGTIDPPTSRPPTVDGPERTLMVADVVGDTVTRLSRHPYTGDRGAPGQPHHFAWRTSTTTRQPSEPLPDVIADLVATWREPIRNPRSASDWALDFQRWGYEVTTSRR
jgi:hypothetical protein